MNKTNKKYKSSREVKKEAKENSFFGNLNMPNVDGYIDKKATDEKLTLGQSRNKIRELENKYEKIQEFIRQKKENRIKIELNKYRESLASNFTKYEKLYIRIGRAAAEPYDKDVLDEYKSYLEGERELKIRKSIARIMIYNIWHVKRPRKEAWNDRYDAISWVTYYRFLSANMKDLIECISDVRREFNRQPELINIIEKKMQKEIQA